MKIPSLRILQEAKLSDAKKEQNRFDNWTLIVDRIINAIYHGHFYHNRMARALSKKDRPRYFSPRKLVLKRIFLNQDETKSKLLPN